MKDKKILIISGPTASGKSALALGIAKELDAVIINADSMQLYKELPILSAQPSKEDFKLVDHRLYSVLSNSDDSSVSNWLSLAIKEIDSAFKRAKLPIIVGGTGMYISKLIDGINEVPEIQRETRNYVADIFSNLGAEGVIKELIKLGDEEEKIEGLDKQRLIRRLEVLSQTGKSLSHWQSLPSKRFYDVGSFIHININPDRDILYNNCNNRLEKMMGAGAMAEVGSLLEGGLDKSSPIIKTIGFLEIKEYLEGRMDKKELMEKSSQKTRNYAKRQLTWFRNQFKNKVEVSNVSRETPNLIINRLNNA